MTDKSKDAQLDHLTDSALKIIMEASPVGIIVFGSDARVIYANPLALKFFAKSPTEIFGLRCGDFIDCANRHKDFQGCGFSVSCANCALFRAICSSVSGGSKEVLKEGEAFLERDAGLSDIWVKFKVISIIIEGSKFILMTIDDITGYKQDEERLNNTLSELSVIHEHAPIAMMLVDQERRVCKVNGFAARFADRPVKEMIGLRGGEALRCLHHLDSPEGCGFGPVCADCRVRNAVLNTFETRVSQENIEAWLPFVRGDSIERRCLLISTAHLKIHNSERVLVCAQDITDRKSGEEALRQSEAFIKSVMDNLPIGVAVNSVLPSPKFEYMNDNFVKFYRTTKEALSEPGAFWDVVYEDPIFRQKIKNRVLENCASGDPEQTYWEDIPITRKGEGTFFISAKNIPIPEKNLMISTVWDVTEHKHAESAIKESHQRVLTILNNIDAIVYVIDMNSYEVLFANQYVRDNFGVVEGEKCWKNIQSGQTGPCDFCTNEKLVDADGNPTGVYRWEFKNAKTGKWYDCHDSAIKWIDERLVRMEIAIDITDRKKAEQALKNSEEKHRRLFETMSQGVIYQDATGAIISANPAAERILGLFLDQMLGKTSMDPRWKMIWEDGSDVPGTQHPAMEALQTGRKVGPVTRRVFHPDKNAHIWLSITAIPLFQPGETTPFSTW